MNIIRYSHFELSKNGDSYEKVTHISESPFMESAQRHFTDYIKVNLPNAYFVCGYEKAIPEYTVDNNATGIYFHWCVNGRGTYNGTPFKVNDVWITSHKAKKLMIADSDEPWEIFMCAWKGSLAEFISAKTDKYKADTVYHLKGDIDFSHLFKYLIYSPHRTSKIDSVIRSFSDILFSEFRLTCEQEPIAAVSDKKFQTVLAVESYINDNLSEVTVEKIAAHFHFNRKYITRIFHELMGMTISEYIAKVKLQKAEALLITSTLAIEEISFQCGYASYSSFIKAFKKKNGITPTEFLKFSREI